MSSRELFERHPGNPILTSADWPYPVNAVFNPAAAIVGGETLILARVEDLRGISHLSVARSSNGVDGWTIDPEPLLAPVEGIESEEWGFEDPRVVWIPELGRWSITCTSYGPPGPAVYLALTDDFRTVDRHGRDQGRRRQERRAPVRAHRRQVDPLSPSEPRGRCRLERGDRTVALRRPDELERPRDRAGPSRGRLVGLAAGRHRPTSAPHRSRLADHLSRRQGHGFRRPVPPRSRAGRSRRARRASHTACRNGSSARRLPTNASATSATRSSRAA